MIARIDTRNAEQKRRDVPQEASNNPSGLNFTEDIDMVWPLSVCLSSYRGRARACACAFVGGLGGAGAATGGGGGGWGCVGGGAATCC